MKSIFAKKPERNPLTPYTVREAARTIGWTAPTLLKYVRAGKIRRIPVGKRMLIPADEVQRICREGM